MRRLDQPVRERVSVALDRLADDPHNGTLRKLSGREEWRLRVGDWRAIVTLDSKARTVIVKQVLPRGRAYDR
jgi:mRNA interferase RelE/StbE